MFGAKNGYVTYSYFIPEAKNKNININKSIATVSSCLLLKNFFNLSNTLTGNILCNIEANK